MSKTKCPDCGKSFSHIGGHWRYNNSHRPKINSFLSQVITGSMMGDGSLDRSGGNPIFTLEMINEEYLEYIDSIFGVLSTGVKLKSDSKRVAERSNHSGFKSSGNPDNFSEKYRFRTVSHPQLWEWDWYTDNGKVWPKEIELTPTVLKHWYCGDGSLNNNGSRFYIEFHCVNERENKDKIEKYFEDIGIAIDRWRDQERSDGGYRTAAIFNKQKATEILEYMEEPAPGFEYKWDRKK